jgi:hypothetical protein
VYHRSPVRRKSTQDLSLEPATLQRARIEISIARPLGNEGTLLDALSGRVRADEMDLDLGESLEEAVRQRTPPQAGDACVRVVREDQVGRAVRPCDLHEAGQSIGRFDADDLSTEVGGIVERLLEVALAVIWAADRLGRLDHRGHEGGMHGSGQHCRSTDGSKRRRAPIDEHDDAVGDER